MVRQLGNSNRTNSEIYEESSLPGVSVSPSVLPSTAEGGKLLIGATKWIERQHVELSQVTNFADAITRVGANGEIWVDVNETLAGSSYTVPHGISLIGLGGVLTASTATTLTVQGPVESQVKLFDHADHGNRGTIDVLQPRISVRWFGALDGNESYVVVDNTNAIASAWLAGRKANNNQLGGTLYFPGPVQFFSGLLDVGTSTPGLSGGGHRIIEGDSQRMSMWRLAAGENSRLLKAEGSAPLFNGGLKNLSFHGDRDNNVSTQALVYIDSYNLAIENCHFQLSNANGLEVFNAGQINVRACDSENHDGWAYYLHGVNGFTLDACGCDNCLTGGLLIEWEDSVSDEHNKLDTRIVSNFYAENTPICVKLKGVGGVHIDGITTAQADNTVLHLATHTDAGGVVRSATNNLINLRGVIGQRQKVKIDLGCISNTILVPVRERENILFEDSNKPGLNKIMVFGSQAGVVRDLPPMTAKDFASVAHDTSFETIPIALNSVSGTQTESFVPSFIVHPAAAHLTAQSSPVCLQVTDTGVPPNNNRLRINKTNMAAGDYWVNMLLWFDYTSYIQILIQRADAKYYDWSTRTFLSSGDQQEFILEIEGGRPQWVSVPFTLASLETLIIHDVILHNLHFSNKVRPQYHAIVDKENAGLIYMNNSGVIQGSGDHFESTTANLPPAGEVPLGTQIWDTTLNKPTWTNGTAWIT